MDPVFSRFSFSFLQKKKARGLSFYDRAYHFPGSYSSSSGAIPAAFSRRLFFPYTALRKASAI